MMITDVHLAADETAYVAGYEPPGSLAHALIPGALKIFRSTDGRRWSELPVDYRAVARRAVLASAGGDLWVATDTGMILKLVAE